MSFLDARRARRFERCDLAKIGREERLAEALAQEVAHDAARRQQLRQHVELDQAASRVRRRRNAFDRYERRHARYLEHRQLAILALVVDVVDIEVQLGARFGLAGLGEQVGNDERHRPLERALRLDGVRRLAGDALHKVVAEEVLLPQLDGDFGVRRHLVAVEVVERPFDVDRICNG